MSSRESQVNDSVALDSAFIGAEGLSGSVIDALRRTSSRTPDNESSESLHG